ncbi:MAG: cyclic pyranopterin monophosphate synthase MoaC [Ignisphaera sp.]|nr:cyclic pyranopterin monophosphate synthase MoaC [Ignisphaera sp.]
MILLTAKMIDISGKDEVYREAIAKGCIKLRRETVDRIKNGDIEKGDVFTASALTAIQAAKHAPSLLPFCHSIRIDFVKPNIWIEDDERVCVEVLVKARERTGVEMEALTAVSISLLNIWDMVKAYEKDENGQYPYTSIENIHVVTKTKILQLS